MNTCVEKIESVKAALTAAHLQLCATHNLLATDRPDLPFTPETSWTTNNSKELAGLDAALEILDALSTDSLTMKPGTQGLIAAKNKI